jgi:hypothetical protein
MSCLFKYGCVLCLLWACVGCRSASYYDKQEKKSSTETPSNNSDGSSGSENTGVQKKCEDLKNTQIDMSLRDVSSERISAMPSRRSNARTDVVFSETSDFHNDDPVTYGFDASSVAFEDVNNLLCVLEQTRYLIMAQAGKNSYRAWVDLDQCERRTETPLKSSGGFREPNLRAWLVEISGRFCELEVKPLKVSFWGKKFIHSLMDTKELADVYGTVEVHGLGSVFNPFGAAELSFTYTLPVTKDTTHTFVSKVSIAPQGTDEYSIVYGYVDSTGQEIRASMVRKEGSDEGYGQIHYTLPENLTRDVNDGQNAVAFAFNNEAFVSTSQKIPEECAGDCQYDLQNNNTVVWRMGLYDEQGKRDARQTSMSLVLNYKPGQSREDWIHGWIDTDGYHVVGDYNVIVDNIYEEIYEEKPGRRYEDALHAKGVLHNIEKTRKNLASIEGWDLVFTQNTPSKRWWVRWNNTSRVFQKMAFWDTTSFSWVSSSGMLALPIQKAALFNAGSFSDLQTQAPVTLGVVCTEPGGEEGCYLTSETEVQFAYRTQVFPSDISGALDLFCMKDCPKPASLGGGFYDDLEELQVPPLQAASEGLLRHYYVNKADMTLYEFSSGEKITRETKQDVPLLSGWMVAQEDVAHLACENNPSHTCSSALEQWNHVYQWKTGPTLQDQYYFLKEKNGSFIPPSPRPLYFYTQVGEQPLFLTYWGFGELEGIPFKCVNVYNHQEMACDAPRIRKVPLLNLPDGMVLQNQYVSAYLKAVEVENVFFPLEGSSSELAPAIANTPSTVQLSDALETPEQPSIPPGEAVVGGVLAEDTCTTVGCDAPAACDPSTLSCDPHAVCDENLVCVCAEGYKQVGMACVDEDECASSPCDENAECINSEGGFYCACKVSYAGDGFHCEDDDECYSNTHGCDPHAQCTNASPGYTCACLEGYEGDGYVCADVAPPLTPVVSGSAFTNNTTPTWTWVSGGEGNGTYSVSLNGTPLGVLQTHSYTQEVPLEEGEYTLEVAEHDDANHVSAWGSFKTTVDTTPPAPPTFVSATFFDTGFPTWEWESTEPLGVSYRVRLDSRSVEHVFAESTLWTPSEALSEGEHILEVVCVDAAGNTSESASYAVVVQLE